MAQIDLKYYLLRGKVCTLALPNKKTCSTYTHLAVRFHDSIALNRDALTHVMNKCIHQPICW